MKGIQRIFCITAAFILLFGLAGNASAANKKIFDQVKNEYASYEKKTTNTFETYREKTRKAYEVFRDKEQASFDAFDKQTDADLTKLTKFLSEDLTRLESQYGGNKDFAEKLRKYNSQISPTSLGSPMQRYAQSINPNYLGGLMTHYKNAINENYLGGPMTAYKNAVNENYLGGPMTAYKNTVNENYLGGPMTKLKNNSRDSYLGGIIQQHKRGKLSQKEALKQWNAMLQKERKHIQSEISKLNKDISRTIDSTTDKILSQKSKTVNGILDQRENSLQTISDMRAEYFGEGITFEILIPDLGENQVMIDGKWFALHQPPVLQNGEVLVPLRAVFEAINPGVKLQKKDDVITIAKPSVKMAIGSKRATVNGKDITLSTAPIIVNGQTMIPLQLVSASFGNSILWDPKVKTVFID
ncbi:copper amine oxidase N-terminal domain-containing protein [Sporosarcina koreensis]|uniref:copper amine oxidase N-terminal domain-containing protein n=1 Tax=Bacillales TaxID=1385 RepID=UPI00075784A7|nr:copper amine oxidase N-terminal domain-containing protein [Sporosarcina koreensis]